MVPTLERPFKRFRAGDTVYLLFRDGVPVFDPNGRPRVFESQEHFNRVRAKYGALYLKGDTLVNMLPHGKANGQTADTTNLQGDMKSNAVLAVDTVTITGKIIALIAERICGV